MTDVFKREDEHVKLDVVSQLEWDDDVDASTIKVTVENGIVFLEGEVPDYITRISAVRDTMSVRGIRSVEDRLSVKFADSGKIPGDAEIMDRLRESIRSAEDVGGDDIFFSVENGEVKFEGTVASYLEKKKIEQLAARIYGVREIVNELIITPTENVEDKRIADALNSFLESEEAVSPGTVEVWVEDGAVRLTGTVSDLSEYQAAVDAAERTPGVREIWNNLVVR